MAEHENVQPVGAVCSIDGTCSVPAPASDAERVERESAAYQEAVRGFHAVDVPAVEAMIAERRDFYLYVGRVTCRWCRRLIPVMVPVFAKRGVDVFYLDSTDSQTDEGLSAFRDRYGVTWVPTVLHFDAAGSVRGLEVDLDVDDDTLREALERELACGFSGAR